MDKTAIKNYAIWARVQLIESCKQRAFEYCITEDSENRINIDSINGRILTAEEKEQRRQLIEQINQKGYSQVMEEAAYTWFNRFIALRFMEVNGYLPSKVRVFTDEENNFKPEILKEAMTVDLDGIDRTKVADLLEKQDNEALYKYLLITQCNALNSGLPYMFETISNWTELLFPDNLLRNDSVVGRLISDITVDDWSDEVEIIGWLYQYYISEKHEEVIDPLHGKVIKKEDIPAATQLFTTDWVVRYIVDNSLGRYWIERHTDSKLADSLEYFVVPKDGSLPTVNESITPEEIKVLDPCVGSGHFLSYAFDVLLNIYRECGWSDRDAAKSIVEHNVYGLDIDDRAVQLACFALAMKARKYNRRIIDQTIIPNIYAIQDSSFMSEEFIQYISNGDASIRNDLNELGIAFRDGKELGSIIKVPKVDLDRIITRINYIQSSLIKDLKELEYKKVTLNNLLPFIKQVSLLADQYEVVVTNPPYLNRYSPKLKAFINNNYADYKGDLFSVFMVRDFGFCKANGYSGFMTPMVWMFIKTYEELRSLIIKKKTISTLVQFEYSAFEEATVPICAFVLKNGKDTAKGMYFKLSDYCGGMEVQRKKVIDALGDQSCGYYYETEQASFLDVPGIPVAYWVSEQFLNNYKKPNIAEFAEVITGMTIGDNKLYLRLWYEVNRIKMATNRENMNDINIFDTYWIPYSKGGPRRNWYGNYDYIVNWKEKDNFNRSKTTLQHLYLKEAITWPFITSGSFSARILPKGFLWDVAGSPCFFKDSETELYGLGLLCSKVADYILNAVNPTINVQAIDIAQIPMIMSSSTVSNTVVEIVSDSIAKSKLDWDAFETSWDFKKHPLI